jgi:hypothetical protein
MVVGMTETMTQEALLDLIYAYADAREEAASSWASGAEKRLAASEAHLAVLDAVRSLPIEAGR